MKDIYVIFTDAEILNNQTLFGPFSSGGQAGLWAIVKQAVWGGSFDILKPVAPFSPHDSPKLKLIQRLY